MSSTPRFDALKGVQDILPPDVSLWQKAEMAAKEIFGLRGFEEIRPPLIEPTALFTRGIGETTDIVEKEMYTFPDRAGRSITLRPEGTASVVRAYVEHHLHALPPPQKFFYSGPMFRYERPQKGRFRQFHQLGVEAFGVASALLDAEVIAMLRIFLAELGLDSTRLEINSIGCEKCRPGYRDALRDFFSGRLEALCPDCKSRFERNPLRILDCKVERCGELRKGAPRMTDFLCEECRLHFGEVLSSLSLLNIPYVINPEMVRGLDYYTRTTFEVTSEHLGAQNAVAAGGRYDRLVEEFGGPPTPGIGFAIGMERLIALVKGKKGVTGAFPDVYVAPIGEKATREAFLIAERLRARGLRTEAGYDGSSLRSQLRKADRLSARYVLILGDEELSSGKVQWKNLRDGSQGEAEIRGIEEFLSAAACGG